MMWLLRIFCRGGAAIILILPISGAASGFDPLSTVDEIYSGMDLFSTRDEVSTSPAKDMTANRAMEPCQFTTIGSPLSLLEAVERALCNNPQTRQT
jgi:hypothetical protein